MTMRHLSDMVRDQDPLVLRQQSSVASACQHMRDRRVGAVLVTDAAGRLLGIFTGRDAVARVLAEGRSPSDTRLADVMTRDPATIPRNARRSKPCGRCRMAASGTCRWSTATGSSASSPAATSAGWSRPASTRRPACGSGSEGGPFLRDPGGPGC